MKKKKQKKSEQEKPKKNLKELKKIRQKRKDNWDSRWHELIKQYNFIVPCLTSNVSSLTVENLKKFLESIGCKLVMFKKSFLEGKICSENKEYHKMASYIKGLKGGVYLAFLKDFKCYVDLCEACEKYVDCRENPIGKFAPNDFYIKPGPSTLTPTQTSFFAALNIATKISRGMIEILNEVKIVSKGEKVSLSAQGLIKNLKVKPFIYYIVPKDLFHKGKFISSTNVLKITEVLRYGLKNLQAASIEAGVYNPLSAQYHVNAGLRKLKQTLETAYRFLDEEERIRKEEEERERERKRKEEEDYINPISDIFGIDY